MNKISIVTLIAFLITASNGLAAKITDLDDVVVTATRIAQHDYKIAGNVTVIDQEAIQSSNATTVMDLLNQTLGVHVYDYGTAKSTIVDIRGFGETAPSNVLILVNDRKINSIDLSGPDLSRIPIGSVERIEIVRGGASVLYGDNAVGGVVNIITKRGQGDLHARVGATYDSYASRGTDIEASGKKNNVSFYTYAKYLDEHGYRENSDALVSDFNARIGYDMWEKVGMDLNVLWHDDHVGLPSALSDSQLHTLGRKASAAPDDFADTKDRSVNLTLDVNPWPEDVYFGKLVLDILWRNRDVYDEFVSFGSNIKRKIDTMGYSGKYIFDTTIFDKEVNFVTGIDFYDNENHVSGSSFFGNTDMTIDKDEFGIYGFLEYELFPKLFVNGGTRYQKADYNFDDRALNAINSSEPDEWVSMGGLKYEYAPGSNLHASAQQTFRFLATDEWYSSTTGILNLDLQQQTGVQYEVGIKHNFNDVTTAHLTPYYMELDNEIFFDPLNFKNSNIDQTRRIGVEIGQETNLLNFFEIDFLDKLKLLTNYNYQNPQITKGPSEGNMIPFVPEHQASMGIVTTFLKHYNVSLTGRYIGSRYAISDFSNIGSRMKPYYVLDSKVSYQQPNWEIYAAMDNVTDYRYVGTTVFVAGFGSFYYPAPQRNYTVGMNIKF